MSRIYQCDRCKCVHCKGESFTKLVIAKFHTKEDEERKFDLCNECAGSLNEFVENQTVTKNYRTNSIISDEL